MPITVECNSKELVHRDPAPNILITPAITPDFWLYRVALTSKNAIVAFPKFGTIGIGFQNEEDWNTNLPYTCAAEEICDHIKHNAADRKITRPMIIEAIKAIQGVISQAKA
jgi:hypothetical protein